ncbi:hypothetical protein C1G86_1603 [Dehalococcoides mccartyi]|uniref:Uncharacterized protein n=1 Tax=Dehalococcoides mccartyi TaxID=61435 RepID=A0A328EN51_9CHLR|nr:hypothetical protein C1G86_1603 [Dehalococcoides mccartyi]
MPIKGVTEVVRLPRLGKIRLGIKKENASGVPYPCQTDHFVCPVEVKKVFGEQPRDLRIMFPTEDQTQWASQYLRCYSASRGLVCRGDGETAVAKIDIRTGEIANKESIETEMREITCNPAKCAYYQKVQCRRVMNLQFLLPDCPGFGVYQLDTSSFYSIVNVNSSLELIRGTCGRLSMIPLSLKLVAQEVQPEGMKKTVRVLSMTAPYSLVEIQKYAQIPPGQVLLLPPPDNEVPDDLFPAEILGKEEAPKTVMGVDKELVLLWDRVKSKVWQMGILNSQITNWFQKNCNLELNLYDLDLLTPPTRIKAEHLERFLKTLERQSDQT